MPEHKTILITRPVNDSLMELAREHQIKLDSVSFIETEPVQSIEIQQEVALAATEYATVVFTSMNAVEAVIGMLNGEIPDWNIYCLGQRTVELVSDYFGKRAVAGTADSASLLADEIIESEEVTDVIFFCGNQRRDELPQKLANHDIDVNEIVVYETIPTSKQLDRSYDGVIFFSPSAVESFFSHNQLNADTVVFAIGETTAQTIQRFCTNTIIISAQPGKAKLVQQAISYFERGDE